MKIIYLHQYFNTPEMSGGTRSYEMARRMVAAGHEVHMVTSLREGGSCHKGWFQTVEAGINVHWYPVPYSNTMGFSQRIRAFFVFALAVKNKLVELCGDVIFATSTPLTVSLPAVYASKKQKIPMVFEVRDLWPELPIAIGSLNNPLSIFLAKLLERFAYKNAKAINVLSPGMKKSIVKKRYPSTNVSVIPNSSDIEMFRVDDSCGEVFRAKRAWLGDSPLLLYTGTFGLINDVAYLVRLAVELDKINSDVKILAIGGGMEFEEIKARASSLGLLNKNFYIEGYLKKKDIPAALNAATIACSLFIDLPEMRSNSANKFFDALAAGKPIMINYGGWMHDLIKFRRCGLVMWGKPLNEVAKILHQKIHDTQWLQNSSNASMELAECCFDRDHLAMQLLNVLESTVAGKSEKAEGIAPGVYD
jgi:glycosyltransferase involved in cell wall biosynthesis